MNSVVPWNIQVHSVNRDYGTATIITKKERGEREERGQEHKEGHRRQKEERWDTKRGW